MRIEAKAVPRDFYANHAIWKAVYAKAVGELKDAMDLAYLTGQRPADVLVMRRDDIEDKALGVKQKKTHKKLRIMLEVDGVESGPGRLDPEDAGAERVARLAVSPADRVGKTRHGRHASPSLGRCEGRGS
ncbi:hypothetical protein HU738_003565 [Pseudomonas sp. RW4S2]|uniref:Phage integrase family protein n=1 Tax=Pseudomonas vlassakiae TaxID=485888 RepID=A0ABS6R1Z8_9PSED|nr:hypothetical protein [Pseudomonas vlassakiae]